MAVIERIYKQPQRAYLFDKVIQDLQDALGGIGWLSHIFGRAERLVKRAEGRNYYTPNVYLGKDEYYSLLPDNRALGNYAFFVMEEPQMVSPFANRQKRVKGAFSLIVWVDMRTLGESRDDRNTEKIKDTLLKAVSTAWLKHGEVSISRIYERAENVFAGFSLDEIDNQFLMSPYAGFRLQGEILTIEECSNQ